MTEDIEFNAFLKAKLEEGIEVPRLKTRAGGARLAVRWRTMLLAASLAGVCAAVSPWFFGVGEAGGASAASDTLELFEVYEGTVADNGGSSFADRLLAWQDAPYNEVLQ